jgi:succinyl-CoA synthetase beta subunit
MSQLPIREYDAKQLIYHHCGRAYTGYLITALEDLDQIPEWSWVIKPDQLFGKRGKYWLVGVKLDTLWLRHWLATHDWKNMTIAGKTDTLDTFLVEPFVAHDAEYYLAFATEKTHDVILFSHQWGVDIEEHWDQVITIRISVIEELTSEQLASIPSILHDTIITLFGAWRALGFVSLEINPLVIADDTSVHCLDMVARVDSCEQYRQLLRPQEILDVLPFGTEQHAASVSVKTLDAATWASLKLQIINPAWKYRLLLWWWWASVIALDEFANKGMLDQVANYGELSGNPDRDSNREYIRILLDTMLASQCHGVTLCIFGGIANFTDVMSLCQPLTELLSHYQCPLQQAWCRIMMRRGGIRDDEAYRVMQDSCTKLDIPFVSYSIDESMTKMIWEF